jgi:ATP/maltotriose-dependent transcriptional regulator MalT
MIASSVYPAHVPRTVGAAAEAALSARGDTRRLARVIARSAVPTLVVAAQRRVVDANCSARLVLRLSLDELRRYTLDDLTPPSGVDDMKRNWARMLETECITGPARLLGRDGSRLDVVFYACANALPGLHLIAFAPADWPDDELMCGLHENGSPDPDARLTPRELEILTLAAQGLSGPELAYELVLSPATIKTHFDNVYDKLGVHNRSGAVARAMRLGLID